MVITDPMECLIANALDRAELEYVYEHNGLDFFVFKWQMYIEVKQMHSPRISAQMERADNIIVCQGRAACEKLAELILKGI